MKGASPGQTAGRRNKRFSFPARLSTNLLGGQEQVTPPEFLLLQNEQLLPHGLLGSQPGSKAGLSLFFWEPQALDPLPSHTGCPHPIIPTWTPPEYHLIAH